jgi:polysaccharide pyruvyl transferase WcaK-like protein
MTRPLRICLILHSSRSDNLGVGALTASEVEILREVARRLDRRIEITILDWKDKRQPYVTGPDIRTVDLDGRFLAKPWGFLALVRRQDAVIDIGAGDSFADIYGKPRLRRIFAMKFLTHLARTPLVVAPQTIGPFTRTASRRLARITLNRSALVATRDRLSTEAARELGVRRPVIEASDVALRLPDDVRKKSDGGPPKVGINVSGLLMGGGYTGRNQFGLTVDYPALVRGLIRHFQDHSDGCEVHLVPHVFPDTPRAGQENDYSASELLAAEFPGLVLAPRFVTPSEAKSYIAGMDFFMGARMHACIAALSSGVAMAPMAYSRKFAGLFGSIGYEHTLDCTALSAGDVQDRIAVFYEDRTRLAAEAAAARETGLAKLRRYEDALVELLGEIACYDQRGTARQVRADRP